MHFLVVDDRFGTPIYVILESDPREVQDFPGLAVREVTLETCVASGAVLGRDPARLDHFRGFRSEGALMGAEFILIEPRYVGASWVSYLTAYHPEGGKLHKRWRPAAIAGGNSPRPSARPSAK